MCHCSFHRAIIKFVALKILLHRWEDDNRSVTNSSVVIPVTVTSLVTKLCTTQTYCLTEPRMLKQTTNPSWWIGLRTHHLW